MGALWGEVSYQIRGAGRHSLLVLRLFMGPSHLIFFLHGGQLGSRPGGIDLPSACVAGSLRDKVSVLYVVDGKERGLACIFLRFASASASSLSFSALSRPVPGELDASREEPVADCEPDAPPPELDCRLDDETECGNIVTAVACRSLRSLSKPEPELEPDAEEAGGLRVVGALPLNGIAPLRGDR